MQRFLTISFHKPNFFLQHFKIEQFFHNLVLLSLWKTGTGDKLVYL